MIINDMINNKIKGYIEELKTMPTNKYNTFQEQIYDITRKSIECKIELLRLFQTKERG